LNPTHESEGYPDLAVRVGREKMAVQLKAVGGEMGVAEEHQLRNFMKILGIEKGRRDSSSTFSNRERIQGKLDLRLEKSVRIPIGNPP